MSAADINASELVLDVLPHPQPGVFTKEDGEVVLDPRTPSKGKP